MQLKNIPTPWHSGPTNFHDSKKKFSLKSFILQFFLFFSNVSLQSKSEVGKEISLPTKDLDCKDILISLLNKKKFREINILTENIWELFEKSTEIMWNRLRISS